MKTIFTYVSVLLVSVSVFAEISKTEKNALIKLYKNTNGSKWTNTWDLKAAPTSWYGVEIKEDKVVSLKLMNNNLSGTLPKELGDLTNLVEINFFRNYITGALPTTIGNLINLSSLNIAFN
jgi:Leucine-rich repeat (LRR) protein